MAAGSRWFVRCTTCLSVSAIDEQMPHGTTCGLCAGNLELMGRVERDRLVRDEHLCPCDDRCTSARGPLCSCKCGGKNHGSNVVVHVTRDAGPVPTITPARDRDQARLRAGEYLDSRALLLAQLDVLLARKRSGEFMPRQDFERMRQLQHANNKAHHAREHKTRLRILRAAGITLELKTPAIVNLAPIVPIQASVQTSLF
jgi:hypothetical protein